MELIEQEFSIKTEIDIPGRSGISIASGAPPRSIVIVLAAWKRRSILPPTSITSTKVPFLPAVTSRTRTLLKPSTISGQRSRLAAETGAGQCGRHSPSPANYSCWNARSYSPPIRQAGSLGIAISEAVEDAATHFDTNYALGNVLNHVLLQQTVIGQEARLQMQLAGEEPDVVIGCFEGGAIAEG
jgi:hypothetical protein